MWTRCSAYSGQKPVVYASKALTETEKRYAQIEKEQLAVTFGLERFHQYIYGVDVIVENDHKPLENILKKPLFNLHQDYKGFYFVYRNIVLSASALQEKT